MKESITKKGMTGAIIFLFISIAVVPSIHANVVKASSDIEVIEVTTEACGISGLKPNTVKLTKQ